MSLKEYTIRQDLIAKFANAFAHPARVAICQILCEKTGLYFGEIQEKIPLSKATVSQHIAVLKDAGLIVSEDFPPRVKYSIEKENWETARTLLLSFYENCIENQARLSDKS